MCYTTTKHPKSAVLYCAMPRTSPLQRGRVVLPDLVVSDSSEALLCAT